MIVLSGADLMNGFGQEFDCCTHRKPPVSYRPETHLLLSLGSGTPFPGVAPSAALKYVTCYLLLRLATSSTFPCHPIFDREIQSKVSLKNKGLFQAVPNFNCLGGSTVGSNSAGLLFVYRITYYLIGAYIPPTMQADVTVLYFTRHLVLHHGHTGLHRSHFFGGLS